MTIDQPIHPEEPASGPRMGYTAFLSNSAPFTELPPEVVRILQSHMVERPFASGDFLMRQGEEGTSLMVVADGVVEINTDDETGAGHFIARGGRGQVLGEMALLTDEPRTANVVAIGPVRALVLPAETFHRLAAMHPSISVVLSHLVAARLGRAGRDVLAGKTLDGYKIVRRLGRGGMAVVYEGFDAANHRRVALKMMSHRLVYDQSAKELFQREADAIQAFEHQDIVQMYGRFEAFHTFFIAMEFCDGQPLDDVIRANNALPEEEVRKIVGRVALALNYAHGEGVIHRDVKPANTMLLRDGGLKLMDFGLASPVADTDPTVAGYIVGTPRYMAPEQLSGKSVGTATDFFSLGCMGYELLTGQPLFEETSVTELLHRQFAWEAPAVKNAFPRVSEELAAVVEKLLSKDPDRRAPDFKQMAVWAEPIDAGLITESGSANDRGTAETVIE